MAKGISLEQLEITFSANIKDLQSKVKVAEQSLKQISNSHKSQVRISEESSSALIANQKSLERHILKNVKGSGRARILQEKDVRREMYRLASNKNLILADKQEALERYVVKKMYLNKATKELKKELDKQSRLMERAAREQERIARERAERISSAMSTAFGGVGLVIGTVAALGAIAKSSADSARELENLANQTGVTVNEFRLLDFAAKQYSMTGEQLADITKDLRDKAREYQRDGTGAFQDVANELGITTEQAKELAGQMVNLSGPQSAELLITRMQEIGLNSNQMTQALESMGNDFSKLIPLWANGGEELDRLSSKFNEVNQELSPAQLAQLRQFSEDTDLLSDAIGNVVKSGIAALLTSMNTSILDITENLNLMTKGFSDFGKMVESVGTAEAVLNTLSGKSSREAFNELVAERKKLKADLAEYKGVSYESLPSINPFGRSRNELANIQAKLAINAEKMAAYNESFKRSESVASVNVPKTTTQTSITPTETTTSTPESASSTAEELINITKQYSTAQISERERLKSVLEQIDEAQADSKLSKNKDLQSKLLDAEKNINKRLEELNLEKKKNDQQLLINQQVLASRWRESLGIAAKDEQAIERDNFAKKLSQIRQFYLDNTDELIRFGLSKQEIIDRQNEEELEAQRQHEERIREILNDIREGAQNSLVQSIKDTFSSISDIENANLKDLVSSWQSSLKEMEVATNKLGEKITLTFEQSADIASSAFSVMGSLVTQASEEKIQQQEQQLQEWYDREREAITSNTELSEADRERQLEDLDAKKKIEEQIIEQARKKQFEKEKKHKVASALASTASAVAGALANQPWTPANFVLAGMVGAMGLAQLQIIRSQQYAGKAHNGIDSIPGSGDQTWILKGGERVVQAEANKKLTKFLDEGKQSRNRQVNVTSNITIAGNVVDEGWFSDKLEQHREEIFAQVNSVGADYGI